MYNICIYIQKFKSQSSKIVKYEEKNLSSVDSLNLNLKFLEIHMKANENVSGRQGRQGRQHFRTAGDSGNMYLCHRQNVSGSKT